MARRRRRCPGGLACHGMNRATALEAIFASAGDYAAFERVLAEARLRELDCEGGRVWVCSNVLMPNHWHLVLWPEPGADAAVTRFMKWLTLTHAQRWHAHRRTSGTGALYGARFGSFPVQEDWHFLKVCRYVGATRPGPTWRRVRRSGRGGAWRRGRAAVRVGWRRPRFWTSGPSPAHQTGSGGWTRRGARRNGRRCGRRGRPYGGEGWLAGTAARLGLTSSPRPVGRPPQSPPPPGVPGGRTAWTGYNGF